MKTYYRKLADICDYCITVPVEVLIAKLNLVIRGWANYYSTIVSKKVFHKMDMLLWKPIRHWARSLVSK